MAFILSANAAEIKRNEVGQKWIKMLKEKTAQLINKMKDYQLWLRLIFNRDGIF